MVVLGFDFWQKRFGGDPSIVGQTMRLGGQQYTVVGVAPKAVQGFTAPGISMDMFVPYMMSDALNFEGTSNHLPREPAGAPSSRPAWLPGFPWSRPGPPWRPSPPGSGRPTPTHGRGGSFNLLATSEVSIHPIVDGPLKAVAALLLTVVGLVLLVACTNLAGFLLARASDGRKEIALRLAMGARRWTLIRQLLTETLILGSWAA